MINGYIKLSTVNGLLSKTKKKTLLTLHATVFTPFHYNITSMTLIKNDFSCVAPPFVMQEIALNDNHFSSLINCCCCCQLGT